MTFDEREEFRKFLLGLTGENIKNETETMFKQIKYPPHLYRYRPTTVQALDCLANNKLYFSSAKYYDDPFDTYLYIDHERILAKLEMLVCDKSWQDVELPPVADMFGVSTEQLKEIFSEKNLGAMKQLTDHNLHFINDMVQAEAYSICFSDDPVNECLWLKYAQNHHGFALMYDPYDPDTWLCGKSENCAAGRVSSVKTPIYPVCYTDEPYDATMFAKAMATIKCLQSTGAKPEKIQQAQIALGEQWWEKEKISLIKRTCHQYDREWRMLSLFPYNNQCVKWQPCAVIMGLRTTDAEKNMITAAAQKAGVLKVYQSYITKENKLGAFEI